MDETKPVSNYFPRRIVGILLALACIYPFSYGWTILTVTFSIKNTVQPPLPIIYLLFYLSVIAFVAGLILTVKNLREFRIIAMAKFAVLMSAIIFGLYIIAYSFTFGGGPLAIAGIVFFLIGAALVAVSITLLIIAYNGEKKQFEASGISVNTGQILKQFAQSAIWSFIIIALSFLVYIGREIQSPVKSVNAASESIFYMPGSSANIILSCDLTYSSTYNKNYGTNCKEIDLDNGSSKPAESTNQYGSLQDPIHIVQNEKFRIDQSFVVDSTNGKRYKFPAENVGECTFLDQGKYVACFDGQGNMLYYPIASLIK